MNWRLVRVDGHSTHYPIKAIQRRVDDGGCHEGRTDLTLSTVPLYPFVSGPRMALPVLRGIAGVRRGGVAALRFRG